MYAWVYLCNNPAFLDCLISKLPAHRFDGLKRVVVLTDENNASMIEDFKRIVEAHRNPNFEDAVFETDAECLNEGVERLNLPVASLTLASKYRLFVKMLLPFHYTRRFGTVLFTDDDVLVLRDPYELMQRPNDWGSRSGLDRLNLTPADDKLVEALAAAFNLPEAFDAFDYNAAAVDAGVFKFSESNANAWACGLAAFWQQPYVFNVYRPSLKINNRFRTLDQRALTAHLLATGGDAISKSKYYRAYPYKADKMHIYVSRDALKANAMFVHYCASSQKQAYVDWFKANL